MSKKDTVIINIEGAEFGLIFSFADDDQKRRIDEPHEGEVLQTFTLTFYEPNYDTFVSVVFIMPEPPEGAGLDYNVVMRLIDEYISQLANNEGKGWSPSQLS